MAFFSQIKNKNKNKKRSFYRWPISHNVVFNRALHKKKNDKILKILKMDELRTVTLRKKLIDI